MIKFTTLGHSACCTGGNFKQLASGVSGATISWPEWSVLIHNYMQQFKTEKIWTVV